MSYLVRFVPVCFALVLQAQLLSAATSPDRVWQTVDQVPQAQAGLVHNIDPVAFKAFTLDAAAMNASLSRAPMEFAAKGNVTRGVEITLPKPDGSFARFSVEEVALMEPGLAAKFPEIRTYRGRDVNDPLTSLQLDINPQTLHAQVLSPSGTYYVDPYWKQDGSLYMSYYKRDLQKGDREFKCLVDGGNSKPRTAQATAQTTAAAGPTINNAQSGKNLRTYRLACATSLRYSQYHGGTPPDVAKVLPALVTLNNRVSGVYETELGIRMILVANEDQIIATATNPTPYSDTPGDIQSNPAYIDAKIGADNYDIGHVVTVGSGGIAGLGVVCLGFSPVSGGSSKAEGTTGIDPPEGDGFWIDFVAHEMGHQFGGNHTFDGSGTNCGVNQNEDTAYEPGSGTTIQAYAGVCGNQNLQPHSDPYWHFASLIEMFGYASEGVVAAKLPGTAPTLQLEKTGFTARAPTPDATPAAGTLNPTPGTTLTWKGTAVGQPPAADEAACVEGVNCDTFTLTLSGTPADWEGKLARITFTWPNTSMVDDYDVVVHKGDNEGPVADDSLTNNPREVIRLDPANDTTGTGVFSVHVLYFSVVPQATPDMYQYIATAEVLDKGQQSPTDTCAVETPTGNNPPTVNAGADYKIPARTPFALTGSGSDPDGDPITYCWEEADLGPGFKDASTPDDGMNPIIRSYPPTASPTRIIPRLQELLANQTQTLGEKLPTTTRELKFVVTARDNKWGGFAMDDMKINVIDSGKGFAVTSPNTALTFPGGATHFASWDVANTTGSDINTTHVNIRLSTDGGNTFRILLAENTPNDGAEGIVLPYFNTTTARLKVEAVGNIYFDISDANFTITSPDSDGDGIPDGYETANGLNPNDPADATLDKDGDGQNNRAEFIAGTNLNDPNSVLRIIAIERSSSSAAVTFTAEPNKRYQIEASPDLTPNSWVPISGDLYPTGSTETYNDPAGGRDDTPAFVRRFYRARVFP